MVHRGTDLRSVGCFARLHEGKLSLPGARVIGGSHILDADCPVVPFHDTGPLCRSSWILCSSLHPLVLQATLS
jgi:hypothetical protein